MKYVFKCENENCENCEREIEIEQRITDKHVADCGLCQKPMKRIYTPFTIGVSQGSITKDGVQMPASRAREIDRSRQKKANQGGTGAYWDNSKNTQGS